MNEISFLILFPLVIAAVALFLGQSKFRKVFIWGASFVIMGAGIYLAAKYFFSDIPHFLFAKGTSIFTIEIIDKVFMAIELLMAAFIAYIGIKHRKYHVSLLALIQTGIMLWLEFSGVLHTEEPTYHLLADKLAIVMEIIIAIVGGLIVTFALGYMRVYHDHHKEYKDKRKMFFALMLVFLSAMFGLVFSNNLVWLFFFWEVTTLCSYLLIGYTGTEEAVNNSFRALWMNLLGGIAFAGAIAYSALNLDTLDLNHLVSIGRRNPDAVLIPVMLLSFAALIKSAQLPFSTWLLGAMVAPTPSSALLHSATMVKAGVYLLIRLSPALAGNLAGNMVVMVGGFTFMMTSLLAISQSDAKKVLAYSTVANLGLIVACSGLGIYQATWAAILLIIFHAVSKSLMFLSVGSVENSIGSRDIEDMHGMIVRLPELAFVMIVGIAGMFLAPFGMLISKWAALKAFIDSNNIMLVLFLCFGSAATFFYWTKWLGKLVAVIHSSYRLPNRTRDNQWFSMIAHAAIMIALCLTFPIISRYLVEPFLRDLYQTNIDPIIAQGNMNIMSIMLAMIVVIPFALRQITFNKKNKIVSAYMSGVNTGDDRHFYDSFGKKREMYLANWYVDGYFGESKLLKPSIYISLAGIVIAFAILIGGAI